MDQPVAQPSQDGSLVEIAAVFTRLGFTAFGGPAAHISLMEHELVTRRKWLDRQHFLDLVAAVNFIPGPNSTELAIHLGALRGGFPGLVVAGACFITPAFLIILPIAYLYVRYGTLPQAGAPLRGIVAAIIAIIAVAMIRFARTSLRSPFAIAMGIGSFIAAFALQYIRVPQAELIVLAAAATIGAFRPGQSQISNPNSAIPTLKSRLPMMIPFSALVPWPLVHMSLLFLKIGATLFGSGYVLASYLQADFVDRTHWLTTEQLSHAISVGQITPGPLLTTATFIGYVLGERWTHSTYGGIFAAALATISIFLPSFLFVAVVGPRFDRLRANPRMRGALDAMNAAVVALIFLVTITLARANLTHPASIAIAIVSFGVLLRWSFNATWIVIAAALAGIVLL